MRSFRIGSRPFQNDERETEQLLVVADPAQAVLVPPVGAGAGVVVGEVVPGVAVAAVVLTHRAPRPLGEIRSPSQPRGAI